MPIERRCLVAGCDCRSYTLDGRDTLSDDGEDLIESDEEELQSYCAQCGHTETEHELAPSD
jgi:hypothetical protein